MPIRNSRLLAAAILAGSSGAAAAADIMTAPEIATVAATPRFYLRGDVSYDARSDLEVTQRLADPTGAFVSGFAHREIDAGFDGGVGIGYQATDWLRTDATFHYWKHDLETVAAGSLLCAGDPACNPDDGAGDLEAYELMGNVYADLGTFAGFTPYVGGGLGTVHLSYDDLSIPLGGASAPASLPVEGEESWRFAYALTAGLAYDVTRSLALDVGYRYLDVEGGDSYSLDASAPAGQGRGLFGGDDGFDRHTIQLGLRYKFG